MKHRLILSVLISIACVYYGLPKLSFTFDHAAFYFSVLWLFFALVVIGGNLAALLYLPKNNINKQIQHKNRRKIRQHVS